MEFFVCFLRGINVSGKNIIRMKDFKSLLALNNYQNVSTYIQSGNIVLSSSQTKTEIEKHIKKLIRETYGYDVPVQAYTKEEIKLIISSNPFLKDDSFDPKSIYFVMCNQELTADKMLVLYENKHAKPPHIKWFKNTIYLYTDKGYSNNKIDNNLIEKKLQVQATARNLRTMLKMNEMVS